jgi:endonuclease-3
MPRGQTPRQPSRTGRQDRVAQPSLSKTATKQSLGKPVRTGTALGRKGSGKPSTSATKAAIKKHVAYNPLAPDRVSTILHRLDELYPDVKCALTHTSAWELLVATILSAQSTDVNVNRVTPELFRKYPTVEAFAALTPEQLEPDVRSTGFFRNKSKSVVGAA